MFANSQNGIIQIEYTRADQLEMIAYAIEIPFVSASDNAETFNEGKIYFQI